MEASAMDAQTGFRLVSRGHALNLGADPSGNSAMWFAILGTDVSDSLEKRKAARPAHIARLEQLIAEGRLLVAGAFPAIESDDPGPAGFTGSLILAEFPSRDDAVAWAKDDPYVKAGVYAEVSIKPFRKALPAA